MTAVERARLEALPLTVNGERRTVAPGSTIADLLRDLDLDARQVVVEHNREILRGRAHHAAHALAAGDVVELVHFVGGG
jgi:thiamine biosynthesis protein ThiS